MDAIMIGQILQTYAMNTKASECKGPEICVRKVMQELERYICMLLNKLLIIMELKTLIVKLWFICTCTIMTTEKDNGWFAFVVPFCYQ